MEPGKLELGGMQRGRENIDSMCLLRSIDVEFYFLFFKKIVSFEQLYQIIVSETGKEEKSHSHFRNCLSLSQRLNPTPSAVNPIFPVQKKANPSSHFTPS